MLSITGAGRNPAISHVIFPEKGWVPLDIVGELGLMIVMFMIGVKTDINMLKKTGKKAVAIGLLGTLCPFALIIILGFSTKHSIPRSVHLNGVFFKLAATWGRTSYAVISMLLDELNLLNSKVGRLAMSATLVAEFASTVAEAGATSLELFAGASNHFEGLGSFLSLVGLMVFIVYVARPLTLWFIKKTPPGEEMGDGHFLLVMTVSMLCGLISEVIGHKAVIGCFVLGLALPSGPPLGTTLQARFGALVHGIFVPLFLMGTGFRTDLFAIQDMVFVRWLILFVILGAMAKIAGILVPCYYCKVPGRDSAALVLMMLSKGISESFILNCMVDTGVSNHYLISQNPNSLVYSSDLIFFMKSVHLSRLAKP